MKLATLVFRNLKIMLRSRITVLVILIAPLLAVMMAAVSFDNDNQYALRIGVYGESYPRIANEFLSELEKNSFQVDRMKSSEDCRQTVKDGRHHACILIESDSRKQITMTILVDFSKAQIVDQLLNRVSDKVSLQSSQISLNLTEALVKRIESTKEEVEKNRYIITSLTTGTENVGRQLDELNSKMATFDPKVDIEGPKELVESLDNNTVVAQFSSITQIKDDLIHRMSAVSIELDDALKDSAISETDRNKIRVILSQNDDKIRKISDQFRATASLTQQDLEGLKGRLNNITTGLTELQTRLDAMKDTKIETNTQIRKLKGGLEDNLIKIIVLQTAFNRIGASVDNIKVSREGLSSPIKTEIEPISAATSRLNVIFPTILVFMLMISGTLLSASLVSFHKTNPGSVRDSLLPVHPITRILALVITSLILTLAQAVLMMLIAIGVLGTSIISGMPAALIGIFGISVVFCLLGTLLGFMFSTEQGAIVAGVAITSGALVLSDTLLPIESMPSIVAKIASINPFVIGTEIVRRALVYQSPASTMLLGIFLLSLYSWILFAVIILMKKERF